MLAELSTVLWFVGAYSIVVLGSLYATAPRAIAARVRNRDQQ